MSKMRSHILYPRTKCLYEIVVAFTAPCKTTSSILDQRAGDIQRNRINSNKTLQGNPSLEDTCEFGARTLFDNEALAEREIQIVASLLELKLTPDIPQSEIAATIFFDRAKS